MLHTAPPRAILRYMSVLIDNEADEAVLEKLAQRRGWPGSKRALVRDVVGRAAEIGKADPEELRRWLQSDSGSAVAPVGAECDGSGASEDVEQAGAT